MKRSIYFVLVFLISILATGLNAQTLPVTEDQVRTELEKRGLSEEEVMNALLEKGIEVENLKDLNPEQLLELESIITELEQQKLATPIPAKTSVDKDAFLDDPTTQEIEDIKEKVEDFVEEVSPDLPEPKIKIYGHSFFKDRDLSLLESSTEVKAPGNYILGSGDKIVVSIWGLSQAELALEIDSDGYVENLKRRIFLKGLTLEAAKIKLRQRFSSSYRFNPGEFEVSLSYSRTINVNIQGEVVNPGGYTISAINNAFNVLIAAQGPTNIGSLREIILIKKDGNISNLDFYSYLKNPNDITDASLEEGDVIIIPIAKKLVSIGGGVKRPMSYELKDDEKLSDLIDLAGGYSAIANPGIIQVERFGLGSKLFLDVNSSDISNFGLKDGDLVTIRVSNNPAENFVSINGAIFNEGDYERTNNMLLKDLIDLSNLKVQARRDLAFIKRKLNNGKIIYVKINLEDGSPDLNIPLRNEDEITIYSQSRFFDNQKFSVSGSVRNPGDFQFGVDQNINIKDAIELAGGLRRDASGYAIIHRKDPLNPKTKTYRRVNLAEAYEQADNYKIEALDSLEIFSSSLFDERSTVRIKGAVNKPSSYQYGQGMTIADVLTMSGGFQLGAATNRIEVSRLTIEENTPTKTVIANLQVDRDIMQDGGNLDFELAPYDEIMVRYVPEFELQKSIILRGEVKFPGDYSLIRDNETILDVIERAGGITNEAFTPAARLFREDGGLGYVILKLDDVIDNRNSRFNFTLKDGDVIDIPKTKDFVSITGATNAKELYDDDILGLQNQLNVPYHPGKNAKFYIEQYAGGISEEGNSNDVFVENANGEITKTKNYLIFRNFPEVNKGSKIVVGYKPLKTTEEKDREDVDWSKVLSDSIAQAVSILSLLLLVQRI